MYFVESGGNFDPSIYFKVNNVFSERIDIQPLNNPSYTHSYFIYTSPFIPYTDNFFQIYIQRSDTVSNTGLD